MQLPGQRPFVPRVSRSAEFFLSASPLIPLRRPTRFKNACRLASEANLLMKRVAPRRRYLPTTPDVGLEAVA